MKVQRHWIMSVATMLALLSGSVGIFGQKTDQPKPERNVLIGIGGDVPQEGIIQSPPMTGGVGFVGGGDNFVFFSSQMSFDGKVVKGAPYAAEAITETSQMLADGNRIVRKNSATVYRDSEGRTRRDQTIGAIGPFAAAGDPPQTFFINDPVSGVNYILDPRSRTARKLGLPHLMRAKLSGGTPDAKDPANVQQRFHIEEKVRIKRGDDAPAVGQSVSPGAGLITSHAIKQAFEFPNKPQEESLGKRTLEGVEAEGTRTTMTIPAGAIGNEQPINIVSERWYSPELQTDVMTKHSDPRFGETTYRLTNITRNEPARTLFEVPSDYTIKEGPAPMIHHMRTMKKPSEDK